MNHHFTEPEKLMIFLKTLWVIFVAAAPFCLFGGGAAWGIMRMRRFNRTNSKP